MTSHFVARDAQMQELEKLIFNTLVPGSHGRNVVVVHGLGGIGKTQLVVEFARKHQHSFSAVFWLDGSSEASLKQSFAGMAQRILRAEPTADVAALFSHATIETDAAVRRCQRWLSVPTNRRWLLLIDNVDRDHRDKADPQAYNVEAFLPYANHGSILITSRLSSLRRLGPGIKVEAVGAEQAHDILENNAGKRVESKCKVFFAGERLETFLLMQVKQMPMLCLNSFMVSLLPLPKPDRICARRTCLRQDMRSTTIEHGGD
jgi:hypothetical protein